MKKLTLTLATTAITAAAFSMFVPTAEAGRWGGHRGHFRFHHFHLHNFHHRRHYDDETYYVRRRKPRVIIKKVIKTVPKPTRSVSKRARIAAVKYEDGQGREFDRVSKVWFDGKDQCWKGDKAFRFKGSSWFYGNARWIETSAGWGASSGSAPEEVSCNGIQAFAGKIQQAEAKPAPAAEPKAQPTSTATAPKAEPVKAALKADKPATVAASPDKPAGAAECKKYFPSIGEMVTVPCTE